MKKLLKQKKLRSQLENPGKKSKKENGLKLNSRITKPLKRNLLSVLTLSAKTVSSVRRTVVLYLTL